MQVNGNRKVASFIILIISAELADKNYLFFNFKPAFKKALINEVGGRELHSSLVYVVGAGFGIGFCDIPRVKNECTDNGLASTNRLSKTSYLRK